MTVMTESREGYKLDLAAEVLSSGRTIRLQALGTSMLPSIWPGDVLSIEPRPVAEIVPGDVVLVARDGRFFIHRLIEKRKLTWTTRGDSLPQDDAPVAPLQVLGRVSLIHRNAGAIVPKPRLSLFNRMFASMYGWDSFRNAALRLHSFVAWLSWGRPRSRRRRQDIGKIQALPEPR